VEIDFQKSGGAAAGYHPGRTHRRACCDARFHESGIAGADATNGRKWCSSAAREISSGRKGRIQRPRAAGFARCAWIATRIALLVRVEAVGAGMSVTKGTGVVSQEIRV